MMSCKWFAADKLLANHILKIYLQEFLIPLFGVFGSGNYSRGQGVGGNKRNGFSN
jgi:hypothetical protein